MTIGRLLTTVLSALLVSILSVAPAFAGFGFGSDDTTGKSGIDLNRGYDINTVTTVSGTVIAAPYLIEKDHVAIDIRNGDGTYTVCVGPASYWRTNGVPVTVNDELVAKGSMAQGQDGKKYLIAQKMTDITSGANLELRTESGISAWSSRGMGRSGRMNGGMGSRGNMMMRGGGMMRR